MCYWSVYTPKWTPKYFLPNSTFFTTYFVCSKVKIMTGILLHSLLPFIQFQWTAEGSGLPYHIIYKTAWQHWFELKQWRVQNNYIDCILALKWWYVTGEILPNEIVRWCFITGWCVKVGVCFAYQGKGMGLNLMNRFWWSPLSHLTHCSSKMIQ